MAVDSEDDLLLLLLEVCELFTEFPQPPGVLITEGLGLWSLDRAVRVVEASLSLQTLIHSTENGGLSSGLGGLNGVDESEASIQVT